MANGSVFEGKSFDEAVKKGLDQLGLNRAEAMITLIEEGKGGFLGFGSRPFRVSVMRRPGGAVREPEEQKERRVSSSRRDDRRGGRGGRDRDRDRDRDKGKRDGGRGGEGRGEARGERQQPGARAEGGRPEGARAEGGRSEGGRGEGGRREGRRGDRRDGKENRESREPRESREAREPREVREAREPRESREPREPRENREPREERRPAAAAAPAPVEAEEVVVSASAPAAGAASDAGAEGDSPRRRRRRGRRGGRGRRRGNAPGSPNEGMPESDEAVSTLEPEMDDDFEGDDFDGDEPNEAPVTAPVVAQSAPVPPAAPAPAVPAPVVAEAVAAPVAAASPAPPVAAAAPVASVATGSDEPADLGSLAIRTTHELLSLMGFDAVVTAKVDGTRVDVMIEVGQDDDLLTGYKGETRMALEHLLNRFINRGEGSRYHLQLEVNDYWLKREGELSELAKQLAEKAVTENCEVVTDLMNSQERRIVHMTLKEDPRVKTYSLGHDRTKRVTIAPADFPEPADEPHAV